MSKRTRRRRAVIRKKRRVGHRAKGGFLQFLPLLASLGLGAANIVKSIRDANETKRHNLAMEQQQSAASAATGKTGGVFSRRRKRAGQKKKKKSISFQTILSPKRYHQVAGRSYVMKNYKPC